MYYTIYKITNIKNNKTYIGKHQTTDLNDGYMGSGKYILQAIKNYGKEFFVKEYLYIFNSETEMNKKEKEILTEEYIDDENNYNAGVGGEGGPHFKGRKHTSDTKQKIREKKCGKIMPQEFRDKISVANNKRYSSGWTASQESRDKMREKKKEYWQKQKLLRKEGGPPSVS